MSRQAHAAGPASSGISSAAEAVMRTVRRCSRGELGTRGATRLLIARVSNHARRNQDKGVALCITPRTFPCPTRPVAPSVTGVAQPPGRGHPVGGSSRPRRGVGASAPRRAGVPSYGRVEVPSYGPREFLRTVEVTARPGRGPPASRGVRHGRGAVSVQPRRQEGLQVLARDLGRERDEVLGAGGPPLVLRHQEPFDSLEGPLADLLRRASSASAEPSYRAPA